MRKYFTADSNFLMPLLKFSKLNEIKLTHKIIVPFQISIELRDKLEKEEINNIYTNPVFEIKHISKSKHDLVQVSKKLKEFCRSEYCNIPFYVELDYIFEQFPNNWKFLHKLILKRGKKRRSCINVIYENHSPSIEKSITKKKKKTIARFSEKAFTKKFFHLSFPDFYFFILDLDIEHNIKITFDAKIWKLLEFFKKKHGLFFGIPYSLSIDSDCYPIDTLEVLSLLTKVIIESNQHISVNPQKSFLHRESLRECVDCITCCLTDIGCKIYAINQGDMINDSWDVAQEVRDLEDDTIRDALNSMNFRNTVEKFIKRIDLLIDKLSRVISKNGLEMALRDYYV